MAHSIIKVYREAHPALRFVGRCYKAKDLAPGEAFASFWGRWFAEDLFAPLDALMSDEFKAAYPDNDAYIGLLRNKPGEGADYLEYWIGMFLPADCAVPEGYQALDFSAGDFGTVWVKGPESDIYGIDGECESALAAEGMKKTLLPDGGSYYIERYGCPRFTTPNEAGEIILDYCFFL